MRTLATLAALVALIAPSADDGGQRKQPPYAMVEARCAMRVFEDGSATFEKSDTQRDLCYFKLTGRHLFADWQNLRD